MPKQTLHLLSAGFWITLLALAVTIATLLGFAGHLWWGFKLLDHLRFQYVWTLLVTLSLGGILRQRWSVIWLAPLTLNLSLILPLCFASPSPQGIAANATQPPLRILHANLNHDNATPEQAIQYIDAQQADLVLLQEVTPDWLTRLKALQHYRLVRAEPRENSHGSALFLPITPTKPLAVKATHILHLPDYSDRPLLQATLSLGQTEFEVLSLHVTRPRSAGTAAFQQTEFDAVAAWSQALQQAKRQVVIIGDFNSTPWSNQFRRFQHDSGLLNSQQGFGLQTTWMANLPPPLRIPIDHCLHSQSIQTIDRGIGPNIGSDHLPLRVELSIQHQAS